MHIVLSGYYGFDNVGDEAILLSIITALRKEQPDVAITVLSNNPEVTAKTYGVAAVNRWKLGEISKVLKVADGLISGGGSLLQDQTGMKTIPYYCLVMRIAKFRKTPVFVYAQGMGPINHPLSRKLTQFTLDRVERITLRDEASKALLEEMGVRARAGKPIKLVPDPVIGLDCLAFRSEWLERQAYTDGYLSVSVRDWPSEVDFLAKIADGLDRLAEAGHTIVFVPMHDIHDEKTSYKLVQMMKQKSIVAPGNVSIEEKVAIIGQSDLLIGMRLHSLIFSAIQATPFIALSYDPKIDAFADIAGQPNLGHVEQDDWDGVALFEQASAMLADRAALSEQLRAQVEGLQAAAQETAVLALETFRGV